MSTSAENEIVQEPSMARNIEGSENCAQTLTTWRSAKSGRKRSKKPFMTAITLQKASRLVENWKAPPGNRTTWTAGTAAA